MRLGEWYIKQDRLALITASVAVNNIVAVTFSLTNAYYVIMFVVFLMCVRKGKIAVVSMTGVMLLMAILCSILVNDIPTFYRPWIRFVTFIMIFLLVSPMVKSRPLRRFRVEVFNYIFLFLQPVVIGSFLLYIAGISITKSVVYAGLTSHSMLLGPCCALTGLNALTFLGISISKQVRYYYMALFVISFLTLGLAASRGAFLGFVAGLLVYMFIWFEGRRFALMNIAVVSGIVLLFSMSLWLPYVMPVLDKNERNIQAGGMASSREVHWEQRIKEFKSSPLFGIGFCSVGIVDEGATVDTQTGGVETGSSWLSVLSMTGILGFLPFLMFFIHAIRQLAVFKCANRCGFVLCCSVMTFWIVHMCSEGYIFAAGGFLFFNIWLLLGTIDAFAVIYNE